MATVKRETLGVSLQEIVESWAGSDPVQLPPGTETAIKAPPSPIDIVDPVNIDPPPGGDVPPPNQATVAPPAEADNGLLLLGGLLAFYVIAVAPAGSRKLSGPSAGWLLPGILLAGGLAFIAWKKADGSQDLAVLNTWADINRAPGEAADAVKAIFAKMSPAELADTRAYLIDWVGQGIELPDTDPLYARILEIAKKYKIFT